MVPPDKAESACQMVITNFDSIVPHFYDEDRLRGAIHSVDRQGQAQVFRSWPFPSPWFSTAAANSHFGEASQIAMNLKKEAKKNPASCYVLDKRFGA